MAVFPRYGLRDDGPRKDKKVFPYGKTFLGQILFVVREGKKAGLFPPAVDAGPQDTGRLEGDNAPLFQNKVLAGLRVSTPPGLFILDVKLPKATDQQILTVGQTILYYPEQGFDSLGSLQFRHVLVGLVYLLNQIRFCQSHGHSPPLMPENE
jgi:hypothetical protein